MQKLLSLLLGITMTCTLSAQFIDLGVSLGATFYSGDVSSGDPRQMLQEMLPAGGIFCRLSNSNQFSTRFSLNMGSVQGDDERSNRSRGLSFRTNITEFTVVGEWHAWRIRHSEHSFTFPYVFGGAGVYHFNPRTKVDGEWVDLQPLGTEGQGIPGYEAPYQLTQFHFPMGVGIKFITRNFTWGLEFGGRYLLTDYLDDVSGTTVNHRDIFLNNGPLAAQLSSPQLGGSEGIDRDYRRGNEPRDWLYMMNITVSYNFGRGIHKMLADPVPCPSFRKRTGRSL